MKAKECKRFDSCSAPLCPMDENSLSNGIWYPDEEICQLRIYCNEPWIRNQKKIARKVRNKDFYFTLEMLSRNCIITIATEGLDPDNNDLYDDLAVKRWLNKHPEKPTLSEAKKEELKSRLAKAKQKINPYKKESNGRQN